MSRVNRVMASRATRAGMWIFLSLLAARVTAGELTAAQIVERAHAAAGGQAWLAAGTNVMRGHATLCRDGDPARCVQSDRYEMYRVYPTKLEHGAHAGSGKFRLDAYAGDRVLFKVAFDGERSYDQNGPVPPERASSDEISAFGFSAIRFALQPGFSVERMPADQVEGHPCYFVRVTDPTGTRTLFGIDQQTYAVRSAGWQTPKGFHQRLYSDSASTSCSRDGSAISTTASRPWTSAGPRPRSAGPSPTRPSCWGRV
jgi:hypothetical protein